MIENLMPITVLVAAFDMKYHVSNNPGAAKRDKFRPCAVCGWSQRMAIHDEANFRAIDGWAHPYQKPNG